MPTCETEIRDQFVTVRLALSELRTLEAIQSKRGFEGLSQTIRAIIREAKGRKRP